MKDVLPNSRTRRSAASSSDRPAISAASVASQVFLERLAPLREPKMVLADKPVGVVAVARSATAGKK